MNTKKITYPVYRKYKNNKSFFKVLSEHKFEEIKLLGDNAVLHVIEAKILPDKNYIYDLTFDYEKHWTLYEAKEYERLKDTISYS